MSCNYVSKALNVLITCDWFSRYDNVYSTQSSEDITLTVPLLIEVFQFYGVRAYVFCVKKVTYYDARILGLKLSSQGREILVLNVYLPYHSADNFDLYLLYVDEIAGILEQSVLSDVMTFGDFNANVDSRFFGEWSQVCEDFHLSLLTLMCFLEHRTHM